MDIMETEAVYQDKGRITDPKALVRLSGPPIPGPGEGNVEREA